MSQVPLIVVKRDYTQLQSPNPRALADWFIKHMGATEIPLGPNNVVVKIPNIGPCKIAQSGLIYPKMHHLAVEMPADIKKFVKEIGTAGCIPVLGENNWRIFAVMIGSETVGYIHAAYREKPLGT